MIRAIGTPKHGPWMSHGASQGTPKEAKLVDQSTVTLETEAWELIAITVENHVASWVNMVV